MQFDPLSCNSGEQPDQRLIDHGPSEDTFKDGATAVHGDQVVVTRT
ncbi:MAG: hypothetical protein JF886_00005 [Candidatus Dormibacteraeota bacterium]|uniref:Uncharacterized protein n=1 Tax=Candidatus Aeolococcus gillhamiae TaxID=3127015 RepID=A0A934JXB8_9BACT|nr:hypothetical protein [Candidatus Dormibacteraeota bacterium]